MATKPKAPAVVPAPKEQPKANPLASVFGRKFLREQLAKAESDLRHGPDQQGWQHNETLRASIEERVTFFRALVALVEGAF